jgi:hypothetical protein
MVSVIYMFAVSQASHRIEYRWRVSLCSLAMSVVIVAVAWAFVPEMTPGGLATRLAMLLAFLPLGFALGLFRRRYFRDFIKP